MIMKRLYYKNSEINERNFNSVNIQSENKFDSF